MTTIHPSLCFHSKCVLTYWKFHGFDMSSFYLINGEHYGVLRGRNDTLPIHRVDIIPSGSGVGKTPTSVVFLRIYEFYIHEIRPYNDLKQVVFVHV